MMRMRRVSSSNTPATPCHSQRASSPSGWMSELTTSALAHVIASQFTCMSANIQTRASTSKGWVGSTGLPRSSSFTVSTRSFDPSPPHPMSRQSATAPMTHRPKNHFAVSRLFHIHIHFTPQIDIAVGQQVDANPHRRGDGGREALLAPDDLQRGASGHPDRTLRR